MEQNYLIIQNSIVANICIWDGNTESWTPPSGSTMLVQATTPTKIWNVVDKEWVLVDSIGNADIGFTWDGEFCVTNQPKPITPAIDPPISTGTQTL